MTFERGSATPIALSVETRSSDRVENLQLLDCTRMRSHVVFRPNGAPSSQPDARVLASWCARDRSPQMLTLSSAESSTPLGSRHSHPNAGDVTRSESGSSAFHQSTYVRRYGADWMTGGRTLLYWQS